MELLALCGIMIVIISYMFYLLFKKDVELSKTKQDLWSITSQKNQLVEENTKLKLQLKEMRIAEMIVDEAIPGSKDSKPTEEGLSAFEIFQQTHPEVKTVEEFLDHIKKDTLSVIPEARPRTISNADAELGAFCLNRASLYGSIARDPSVRAAIENGAKSPFFKRFGEE
jgi:regulator of replication initiation timing